MFFREEALLLQADGWSLLLLSSLELLSPMSRTLCTCHTQRNLSETVMVRNNASLLLSKNFWKIAKYLGQYIWNLCCKKVSYLTIYKYSLSFLNILGTCNVLIYNCNFKCFPRMTRKMNLFWGTPGIISLKQTNIASVEKSAEIIVRISRKRPVSKLWFRFYLQTMLMVYYKCLLKVWFGPLSFSVVYFLGKIVSTGIPSAKTNNSVLGNLFSIKCQLM